jgi:hypothetical protein
MALSAITCIGLTMIFRNEGPGAMTFSNQTKSVNIDYEDRAGKYQDQMGLPIRDFRIAGSRGTEIRTIVSEVDSHS